MDIQNDTDYDSLTTIECDLNSDLFAKLRRLKIQESILTASLNKPNSYSSDTVDSNDSPDWKEYSVKLKKSIIEIKNMFEDIKAATSESHDNLENIDLDAVRKDVLRLDGKIKSLESFISSELSLLKINEEKLVGQMNEKPKLERKIKGNVKLQSKYNEVVPSPVRVMINSPLKYAEVQKFQDFMSKSKNRYGGWNEYNHNIFVLIWNKFYTAEDSESSENIMKEINNNNLSPQFKGEVSMKIPGTKSDDLLSHSKWYSEFCFLKMCQRTALDKWRDNKSKIKKRQNVKRNVISSVTPDNLKLCRRQSDKFKHCEGRGRHEYVPHQSLLLDTSVARSPRKAPSKSKLKTHTFARPTEQWINRCHIDYSLEDPRLHIYGDIESVQKVATPNWRMCLK